MVVNNETTRKLLHFNFRQTLTTKNPQRKQFTHINSMHYEHSFHNSNKTLKTIQNKQNPQKTTPDAMIQIKLRKNQERKGKQHIN